MKLKSGLKLRQLGRTYMIVDTSSSKADLTNVYNLNATAAEVWRYIGDSEFTLSQLVAYVCEEYDVDYDTAHKDMKALIEKWDNFGLIIND